MLDCALISADESFRRQVRTLVARPEEGLRLVLEWNETATDLSRERVVQILTADPRLLFIDLGNSITGLRVVELLRDEAPDLTVVAAGPDLAADALLRVMRAGASEYLPRPFLQGDTVEAFQRVRRRLGSSGGEESVRSSVLSTVFSPKGGVGVTTIATNLAVAARELSGEDVLLLDLAPALGTAALTMGLQPRYSYLDFIQNFHRLDEELFRSFLDTHESGVSVLSSPPRANHDETLTMDQIMGVLRLCRRYFPFVVVDAGHTLTSAADAALLEADHRILVTTPELPTLRNLKRTLESLDHPAGNGRRPALLVLNQYAEGLGVAVRDVENGLGMSVDTVIERADSLTTESINLGRPAVLAGRSGFARSIHDLARQIVGPDHIKVQRGGLLQTLLRPFRPTTPAQSAKEND